MGDKKADVFVVNIRPSRWQDVRDPGTGKLLFRYDSTRRVVEIKHKHQRTIEVSLTDLEK